MELLPSFSLSIDAGLLVLIWIVQVLIYPSFQDIARERFEAHHQRHTQRMGWIAGPLMIAQLALASFSLAHAPNSALEIIRFLTIGVTWGTTFAVSVPMHKKLKEEGKQPDAIKKLVKTNWIRTASWTLVFAIGLMEAQTP